MRLFLFLSCCAAAAIAQVRELATTNDGRQLFFSTTYRTKGSDQFINAKIFQRAGAAYSLVAETDPAAAGAGKGRDLRLPAPSGDHRDGGNQSVRTRNAIDFGRGLVRHASACFTPIFGAA